MKSKGYESAGAQGKTTDKSIDNHIYQSNTYFNVALGINIQNG